MRYQDPKIEKAGASRKYYRIRPYVPMVLPDGKIERRRKDIRLGWCDEITASQAKALKQATMATVNAGPIVVQSQIPFSALAAKFEGARIPQLGTATQGKYRAHLKNHVLPAFGDMKLCDIDRPCVEAWLASKSALGKATRLDLRNLLSAIFTQAANWKLWSGDNLFVDAQGKWTGNYVPAFLRRLPFIVADIGEGRLGVCVDENSTQLSETEGEAMFDDKGEPTQLLKDAVSFVQTYHDESERTRMFCELLVKHDLLTSMNATFDLPNGEKLTVDGLLMVEDAKLQGLKDEAALELFRSGAMSWIVAHQLSMSNFQRISALHNARHMAKAA